MTLSIESHLIPLIHQLEIQSIVMPRYKEYNEVRVKEKAIELFWSNGYGASSLASLTEKMNINKFSFYEAFESKDGLLVQTLEYYFEAYTIPLLERFRTEKDVIGFFKEYLSPWKERFRGCYILTITAETGVSIPGAIELLNKYVKRLEQVISEVIQYQIPDINDVELHHKTDQLLALFTSVPMMHPVKPEISSIEYVKKVLQLNGLHGLLK